MLRTISTNISIITNFGCRAKCWYCIWKGHKFEFINDKTNWVKLEKFLFKYKNKGKVSVSGGGDCLYKYKKHRTWWQKLFKITNKLSMKVDVHTREKFYNKLFWTKINKCVFSSDNLSQDKKYLQYLGKLTKLRITHLITAASTNRGIRDYLNFQRKNRCQFTIKQLTKYSDKGKYCYFRRKYPDIFYLDNGDYNIYYMPDNSITKNFI